uniref:Uncharacterized protein n=1 Tax=viral metagenome TaxID=1070528 RepID=A0A6C0F8B3_9ZZZZ|tara:strand:- start:706 stop:1695 length:990 start_codon:yes stop_codon:yes gene_type:complete
MLEQIQILEDKLLELRDNIKNTFLWIMRNRFNRQTKNQVPNKEEQLKKLKSDYESTENEISNLKMKQRLNEDKVRDLKLLANTQRELEEIRKKKLSESKKLAAAKEKCKIILETNIPKFKELISMTKENISILKDKYKKCLLEYKLDCPNGLEDEEYQSAKNIYSNSKLNLSTLYNQYDIGNCQGNSCKPLEDSYIKLDNMLQRKTNHLNYSQIEHEQCLIKNNERCKQLLKEVKNTNKKTNVTMQLSSNISESFTDRREDEKYSVNSIKANNHNMKNIQNEIKKLEQKEYNLNNPSKDTQSLYYREMNKNILYATLSSVLLYYLFFEM